VSRETFRTLARMDVSPKT